MLGTLRKFLAPPVFEDEGDNFTARNLNVVLLSVFASILVTMLRYFALGKFWQGSAGFIFIVTSIIVGGVYVLFQKRYIRVGSVLAVSVFTLMPFALILMSGNGIHDTAIMLLPVVVIIASLLLPWQGLVAHVLLIALGYGVIVRMEVNQNLITPFSSLTTNSDFTDALTILAMAAVMSGLMASSLRKILRKLSQALKEREISEERYRLLSNLSTDYVFSSTVHKDGSITHDWQAGAFESISGYTLDEFLARGGWRATVHPDDLEIDEQLLEKLKRNEKAVGELRVITKRGDARWVREYVHPVWDERDDRLVGIYGATQNIDEQKGAAVILHQRDAILQAVAHAAQVFLQSSNWRESINQVLGKLGQATVTSHAYIFENHVLGDGTQVTSQRYEWAAPSVPPDIDNPKYQNMPYDEGVDDWVKVLQSGRSYAGNIHTLPEEISKKIQERGLKSILDVPIFVSGKWWGEIGFDDAVNVREWSASEIEILEVAARMIGAAIEREQVDEAFRQNEERHRNELEHQVVERTSQLTAANDLLKDEKAKIQKVVNEVATLRKLSDFLQSSMTIEEASKVVARHLNSLFANTNGGLYLVSDGFADLTLTSGWGEFKTERVIQPNDCWGMRRGRVFVRHPSDASPACAHFGGSIPDESLCLPLMGQNEIIGMLCLQTTKSENTYFTQDVQNLAVASADSIALALANLRLRERLRNQTIRDPLTGIFNRRYLEETLEREAHRAGRNNEPLCVIMFEIDDFKQYNNTFGHNAGDYVLKKIADTMRSNLRRSDFPCRYGGDEFTLLLPNTTLDDGAYRAEELRKAIEALALSFNNQALGQVTVRLGVAAYPKHGETGEAVLKVADDASYRARAIGKNCVVVAK